MNGSPFPAVINFLFNQIVFDQILYITVNSWISESRLKGYRGWNHKGNATVTGVHLEKLEIKSNAIARMTPILKQSGELAIDLEIKRVLSFSGHNCEGNK